MRFLKLIIDAFIFATIWLDMSLLVRIERLCHRIQRLTGRTNYWLNGRMDIVIAVGFLTRIKIFPWTLSSGLLLFVDGWCSALFIFHALNWKKYEARAFKRLEQGHLNVGKIFVPIIFLRVYLLFITVSMWIVSIRLHNVDFGYFLTFLLILRFYLDACDPLPPCKGTFSLKNFLTFKKPAYAPTPS